MQQIDFIYRSSNIKPTIFVLNFLRLNGIYVYERFFDYNKRKESYLYTNFPEISDDRERIGTWISDWYMYFIASEEDKTVFFNYLDIMFPAVIIDATDDQRFEALFRGISNMYYIRYNGNSDVELLHEIVKIIESDKNEQELLRQTADVYGSHKIWQLSVGAYISNEFKQVRDIYKKAVSALIAILKNNDMNFGDIAGLHLQYAICKLAYETNMYCIKNKEQQMFARLSVLSPLTELLGGNRKNDKFDDNIRLLLAQIYDDLFQEPNQAYQIYCVLGEEPYNAYALYRKAEYWKNFRKDQTVAVKYYAQCVAYYPEFYEAWIKLGICYANMRSYGNAINAFENVKIILSNKYQHAVLSPIETEYLYNAYERSGYLIGNHFYNMYQSIREYTEAVSIWKKIDDSSFLELMCTSEDKEAIIKALKERLNVKTLYGSMSRMAGRADDDYLVKEYNKILREE